MKVSVRNLLVLLAIILLASLFFGYQSALLSFVELYLSLTALDLMMIVVVLILFFFFWKSMDKHLFGPLLTLLEEREELTHGTLQKAASLEDEERDLREQIEGDLREAYQEAELRERELLAALQAENLLKEGRAKEEIKIEVERADSEIKDEIKQLREESRSMLSRLRKAVIEKISAPSVGMEGGG